MTAITSDLSARLDLAVAAAKESGQITLGYFRQANFQVETKPDHSPVTIADRQAEQHLRERISRAFPDDGILGEEFGEQPGRSGFRWILDPIDGTKSFVHGVPLYGQLVGVEQQGRSVAGVIHVPALQETVYAAAGQGAWHQREGPPQPARVSHCPRLAEALFLTSEIEGYAIVGRWRVLEQMQAATRITRTWGDAYGYLLIATGRADVMVDPRMHVWDAAALLPIIEEAGGTFTDWQGVPTIHSGNGVATNGKLLDETIAITRRAGP
jgi:histidinol phosphatase-like enzyme (inositol monophosphatase family)